MGFIVGASVSTGSSGAEAVVSGWPAVTVYCPVEDVDGGLSLVWISDEGVRVVSNECVW